MVLLMLRPITDEDDDVGATTLDVDLVTAILNGIGLLLLLLLRNCDEDWKREDRPFPTEEEESLGVVAVAVVVVIRCVCNFNNRGLLIRMVGG